jgi:hypothetical protein
VKREVVTVPVEFLEQLAVERICRFEVKLILRVETRTPNVVHAPPKRLHSILYSISF